MSEIIIYKSTDNQVEVNVQSDGDTEWLSQGDLVNLFERDQSVISRHFNCVFKEGELDKKSNMQKMHIANSDTPPKNLKINNSGRFKFCANHSRQ